MKLKLITTFLAVAGFATLAWLSPGSSAADVNTSEVMKAKLAHAQEVLRGMALEDYSIILSNAQKLSRLSQGSGWYTRQTPEYEMFTTELRRHADALAKAAKNRNLDAASLAYFQLTVSCVNCHKYLRGSKAADAGPVPKAGGGD
jgi:hypothetical protein